MSAPFLAGVVAGYGIAVPVGAIGALIAGLSARTSLRVGAAAGLGAATADGIYAAVAVAGGAAVAGVIAPVAGPLRWIGGLVLLVLAGWTAWGAIRKPGTGARDERPATAFRAYAGILGLTLLNPATVIYFAALVLGSGGAGGGVCSVASAPSAATRVNPSSRYVPCRPAKFSSHRGSRSGATSTHFPPPAAARSPILVRLLFRYDGRRQTPRSSRTARIAITALEISAVSSRPRGPVSTRPISEPPPAISSCQLADATNAARTHTVSPVGDRPSSARRPRTSAPK